MNAAQPDPRRWQALALVCVAFFMTVLDVSIVNVALPSIGRSLHFSQTGLQWVITAYAITFGGFLLLGGRAGDMLGRKRMFLVGLVALLARLARLRAPGLDRVLIAARAVQGLGAAIVSPSTLSIITTTFQEGAERNKALGIWGAMGGGGAAAGVLFGGILTKYLGWEWIFFVNVPVGALVLVLAPRLVRESRAADARAAASTSWAPSRSPAVSRCSSTRCRRRRTTAGATRLDASAARRGRRRLLIAFVVIGDADREAADAVHDLPDPDARRRERRGPAARRGRCSRTSSSYALRPEGARLLAAEDRRHVPRHRRHAVLVAAGSRSP